MASTPDPEPSRTRRDGVGAAGPAPTFIFAAAGIIIAADSNLLDLP